MTFTHNQLVNVARKWLKVKHAIVITEMVTANGEFPDAFGFTGSGHTTLIECKTSVSDFRAEREKLSHRIPSYAMGEKRYYLTPKNLIAVPDIPHGWGLLSWDGKQVRKIAEAAAHGERNIKGEMIILVSAMRRLRTVDYGGVSIRCYTYENPGRPKATLGLERESTADCASVAASKTMTAFDSDCSSSQSCDPVSSPEPGTIE